MIPISADIKVAALRMVPAKTGLILGLRPANERRR